MENKEIRSFQSDEGAEVRLLKDSNIIEGYGIVFNTASRNLGGFVEIITPEAVEGVIEKSDILALLNHDVNRGVLARSYNGEGTLKLSVDSKGVKYSFEAPNFELGKELVEGIKRGDIKGSSFSFTVDPDGEKLDRRDDGLFIRTITKFNLLYDMSPCYRAAYQDTTVALRNLDEFKAKSEEIKEPETSPVVEDTIEELVTKPEGHKLNTEDSYLRQRNQMLKFKNL